MTSIYNILEKFSYSFSSQSIDYIKNYNFNSSTVTDIRIQMENSDDKIPITVNMSASYPWMRLRDAQTGRNVQSPLANLVLSPTSSATVLLRIDLPPDIDALESASIDTEITFDIESGSFLRIAPEDPQPDSTPPKNVIVVPSQTSLTIGQHTILSIRTYNLEGQLENAGQIEWKIDNMSVVQFVSYDDINIPPPLADGNEVVAIKIIRGLTPGTTTITYTDPTNPSKPPATTLVTVTGLPTPGPGYESCGSICTEDSECSGFCNKCSEGFCSPTPISSGEF